MNGQKNIMDKVLALFIAAMAALVIFYRFPSIPPNLAFDEVAFAHLALELNQKIYTPYIDLATGHSTLYFYILSFSFQLFGVNTFALRFPAAIFGVLNAVLIFFVFKQIINYKNEKNQHQFLHYGLPLLISIIFIFLRWHFNFARFAFEATFLLFLELCSIYFYFRAEKKGKFSHWLILSGFFAGLAFNSYTPGRIFFLVPLIGLLITYQKISLNQLIRQLISFFVPFMIIILPLTLYLSSHPDTRIDELSYFRNTELTFATKISYFGNNIASNVGMFVAQGDLNGRHNYPGKPIVNPILAILSVAGLFLAIREVFNPSPKTVPRKPIYFFILYFLVSLLPTLFTYPHENPSNLRTFTVIPSLLFFIAISLKWIFLKLNAKKTVIALVSILILFSSLYELRTYFMYQTQVFDQAFDMKGNLKELINQYNTNIFDK